MSVLQAREGPGTAVAAARDVWSRAIAQLDAGTLTRHDYERAEEKLRAIRGTLAASEQSRVELYMELLEETWADRSPRPVPQPRTPRLVVRAHRVLASAFAEGGDREVRRERARTALRDLEGLAALATDDVERLGVVRLADPLLRLLSALDPSGDDEVLQ